MTHAWTDASPKEPGYYWYLDRGVPILCRLQWFQGELRCSMSDRYTACMTGLWCRCEPPPRPETNDAR